MWFITFFQFGCLISKKYLLLIQGSIQVSSIQQISSIENTGNCPESFQYLLIGFSGRTAEATHIKSEQQKTLVKRKLTLI